MPIDELSAPLGQHRSPQPGQHLPVPYIAAGAGVLAALLLTAWAMLTDGAFRAQRNVIASVAANASTEQPVSPRDIAAPEPLAATPVPAVRTVTIIDGISGNRREIVIPEAPKAIGFDQPSIDQPPPTAAAFAPSTRMPARAPRAARVR